jgi:HlyD family secretion protein
MEVIVDVNENDIVRVKNNDTTIIEVDAYLGKKFKGLVTEIANSATVSGAGTDQVTNFQVKVLILKESYADLIPKDKPGYYPFRPGMSATTDIQTQTKYNVLSVPIQAITTRVDSTGSVEEKKEGMQSEEEIAKQEMEEKDKKKTDKQKELKPREVVFIYEKGLATMKEVKAGIQDDNYIEILSGISDSAEVITAPYSAISKKLKNKMTVEKVDKDKLFATEKN